MKYKIIFIHGWNGSGTKGWFKELLNYLSKNNIDCLSLNFPNTKYPQYEEWKRFFIEKIKLFSDSNTSFLCHSVGCSFLQRYISEENCKFKDVIFIAPTIDSHGFKELENFFDTRKFDNKKVIFSVKKIFILGGGKDYISREEFDFLAKSLKAKFLFFPEIGHFSHYKPLTQEIKKFMQQYFSLS